MVNEKPHFQHGKRSKLANQFIVRRKSSGLQFGRFQSAHSPIHDKHVVHRFLLYKISNKNETC